MKQAIIDYIKENGSEIIKDIFRDYSIEEKIMELKEEKEISRDSIYDLFLEGIYFQDIVYYSTAMEYLRNNDPSLRESIDLAHDQGCDLKSLNSETLATIHYQNSIQDDLNNFLGDFFA